MGCTHNNREVVVNFDDGETFSPTVAVSPLKCGPVSLKQCGSAYGKLVILLGPESSFANLPSMITPHRLMLAGGGGRSRKSRPKSRPDGTDLHSNRRFGPEWSVKWCLAGHHDATRWWWFYLPIFGPRVSAYWPRCLLEGFANERPGASMGGRKSLFLRGPLYWMVVLMRWFGSVSLESWLIDEAYSWAGSIFY